MFNGTFRLGRISGIPISANWSALFGSLFIAVSIGGLLPPTAGVGRLGALALSLAGALAFSLSLLAHELGHALMARRRGVHTDGITLWMFGGVAKITSEPTTPADEAKIAAAGPIVSIALAALGVAATLALAASGAPESVVTLLWILAFANGSLGIFNLLPGLPLDGGRLLRAWRWHRSGDRDTATLTAANGGRLVGAGMMAIGFVSLLAGYGGLWTMALGFIIWGAARVEGFRARLTIARRDAERLAASGAAPPFGGFWTGRAPSGTTWPFGAPGAGPFGASSGTGMSADRAGGSTAVIDVDSWPTPRTGPAGPAGYPRDLSMWPTTDPTSGGKTS